MATTQETRLSKALLIVAAIFFQVSVANAANILFVADAESDTNIPDVLSADGHTVTTVLNDFDSGDDSNGVLQGALASYNAIVWSATGAGSGDEHAAATFTNLSSYISAGGSILVVGYDTIASPEDPNLLAFIGATTSTDTSGENVNGPITGSNILSTGMFDIVGVTPTGGHSDSDTAEGLTTATCVVSRPNEDPGDCAWTLRNLGSGWIAYISNGESGTSEHPSWEDTSAGGDGAYNKAIRNFASNAGGVIQPIETAPVPAVSTLGLVILSIFTLLIGFRLRRKGAG